MSLQIFKTPARKRKAKTIDGSIQDFLKTCSEAMKVNDNVDEYQVYQALGISFAAKLKRMNDQQQIIAELLVNKILSKGLLNQLTGNMDIIENYYIPPNLQPSALYSDYPGTTQASVFLNSMSQVCVTDDSCSSVSTLN